ncbi:MAG: hypothetical protein J6Y43_05060, partial [Clostridia bacterium]|nr:hypothetical protein [Clostridia bacterium]
MEQIRQNKTSKSLLVALLSVVMTLVMIFTLTPAMTLTAKAADTIDIGNISTDGEHVISDGDTLTGYYNGMTPAGHWIKIPHGATVTFNDIQMLREVRKNYKYPNFVCDGDATIILVGTNKIEANLDSPCISVREGYTLTIKGSGSLELQGDDDWALSPAIGAPFVENGAYKNAGNIVFESGTIIATAKLYGYGLGGTVKPVDYPAYNCGDITIGKDAVVTATVGPMANQIDITSAIGSCGTIKINGVVFDSVESTFNYPIAASKVDEYIDAIPNSIVYTSACESAINKAIAYYACTTEAQQPDVKKLDKLIAAELEYAKLTINAIPNPVVYTPACKEEIDKARNAYNALPAAQKALVENYDDLLKAEADYRRVSPPTDLSTLTENYTLLDGEGITGTLGGDYKISVVAGATVTLKDATINNYGAGITCNGNATIILEGTNSVKSTQTYNPGIFVPQGGTLTIKGDGSLTANGARYGSGIGG